MLVSLGGLAAASRTFAYGPELLPADGYAAALLGEAGALKRVKYPEKTELILLTDRPPQLETPLSYFRDDLTPNDAFFVRWHLSGIPTTVDLRTFRLEVGGHVSKPLSLSLNDLQSKFEPVSLVALNQCAGNSRSLFEPRVPGGQWSNGAMGNARWKGVRLKDVLDAAGVLPGAVQVGLHGLDVPPLPKTPRFEKSLEIESCPGRRGDDRLRDERRSAPHAERIPHSSRRSGVVRHVLGQISLVDNGARTAAKDFLDGQGLPHSRTMRRRTKIRISFRR